MTRYTDLREGTTGLRLGGQIEYHRGWLTRPAADALLAEVATAPFRQERLSGAWQQPRETAWYLRWYPPSGKYQRYWLAPPPGPRLQEVLDVARSQYGLDANAVLLNQYRDGHDSVQPRADDEPTMGGPVILSISLASPRRFKVRPADCSASPERLSAHLGHGDLVVMSRCIQDHYVHEVPKARRGACGSPDQRDAPALPRGVELPPP